MVYPSLIEVNNIIDKDIEKNVKVLKTNEVVLFHYNKIIEERKSYTVV